MLYIASLQTFCDIYVYIYIYIYIYIHIYNIYVHTCVGITKLLMASSKCLGCSGTRHLHNSISDLRAQVAANQKVLLVLFQFCFYIGFLGHNIS